MPMPKHRIMERMMRIELTLSAWKAEVLPLNYIRIMVLLKLLKAICKKTLYRAFIKLLIKAL